MAGLMYMPILSLIQQPHKSNLCSRMAEFINFECGAQGGGGGNSDSDFEDGGDDGWRPGNGRRRGAGRGRGAGRIGRGGKKNLYYSNKQATGGRVGALRRGGGRVTFPDPEGEF